MDILVQKQKYTRSVDPQTGRVTNNVKNTIDLIYNNQVFDAFYIKSEMISVKSNKPEEGSTATVGASFRYLVTDMKDDKRI